MLQTRENLDCRDSRYLISVIPPGHDLGIFWSVHPKPPVSLSKIVKQNPGTWWKKRWPCLLNKFGSVSILFLYVLKEVIVAQKAEDPGSNPAISNFYKHWFTVNCWSEENKRRKRPWIPCLKQLNVDSLFDNIIGFGMTIQNGCKKSSKTFLGHTYRCRIRTRPALCTNFILGSKSIFDC